MWRKVLQSAVWRKVLRGFSCLGYLGMLGLIFGLVAYVAFSQFVRRGVTPTPELFGLPEDEALAILTDQGLRLVGSEDDERYDERVPDGHVLEQRPGAGTLVKRGSSVVITLSRGPQLLEIPDVVSATPQAARVTLAAAGLTVGRTLTIFSDNGQPGLVIGQRPAGGARAESGEAVDLFLARESSENIYVMPDLVDRDYDDIRVFFERHGFHIGRVGYEQYTGIRPGTVLRQFPQPGYPLAPGDVIALSVVAPEPVADETPHEEPGDDPEPPPGANPTPSP